MAEWSFLTNHARALLCIFARSRGPAARPRDHARDHRAQHAFAVVTDLAESGYVVKERDGRRNRYLIQHHLPLPENTGRERTIGDLLDVLVGTNSRKRDRARPVTHAVRR